MLGWLVLQLLLVAFYSSFWVGGWVGIGVGGMGFVCMVGMCACVFFVVFSFLVL